MSTIRAMFLRNVRRKLLRRTPAIRGTALKSAISTIIFVGLFLIYLLIEVIAAMAVYMYLNLNYINTFGYLISLSQKLLSLFTIYLVQLYPDLANQAFATILGEMGPKSILLLLLGLVVSTITRFLVWGFGKSVEFLSAGRKPAAPSAS